MLGQRLDNVALELLTVKSNRKSLPSIGKRISSFFSRDLRSFESQKSLRCGKVLPTRTQVQNKSARVHLLAEEEWKLKKAGNCRCRLLLLS